MTKRLLEDDDLMRRAFAAWFRGGGADQPAAGSSRVEEHEDRLYVVLRSMRGIMAVYRVRNDGMLKGLRRWPASIEAT